MSEHPSVNKLENLIFGLTC